MVYNNNVGGVVVAVTKLAGFIITLTITTHAFSYSRFRNNNLLPLNLPPPPLSPDHYDDDHDDDDDDDDTSILAIFNLIPTNNNNIIAPGSGSGSGSGGGSAEEDLFFFGLATAPAHVEDRLDDAWLQFAKDDLLPVIDNNDNNKSDAVTASVVVGGDDPPSTSPMPTLKIRKKRIKIAMEAMIRGFEKYEEEEEDPDQPPPQATQHNVAAWHNAPNPEERLRFWSDPDPELQLAKDTGVSVFRMGIDWARIMPKEPVNDETHENVNYAALERYKWIIRKVRSYGMKVMLTLFHHSLPPWAGDYGGWKLEKTVDYFMDFTRLVVDYMSDIVDYWVTFNEPHVFCMLTYCAGAWPGGNPDMLEVATSALPTGVFHQAMHLIALAHSQAYEYIHHKSTFPNPIVGVAHHVSFMRPYGLFDIAAVTFANSLSLFPFIDEISKNLDFIGINYYGQEVVCGAGLKLVESDEYSESGRGVYPDGLYRMLLQFHDRYKHLNIPFIITENGVSDETDLIRRPYLLEHLIAIYAAMRMGVRVVGYLFWTISDNWEWADGYGPKFGLVAVDRANDLRRIPRPSYHLFTKVVSSGKVTRQDREYAWNELCLAAKQRKKRPFYRAADKNGFMYAGGLDEPVWRPYVERDWRFGHYEMEGLQDPLSRFSRYILRLFSPGKKRQPQNEDPESIHQPVLLLSS